MWFKGITRVLLNIPLSRLQSFVGLVRHQQVLRVGSLYLDVVRRDFQRTSKRLGGESVLLHLLVLSRQRGKRPKRRALLRNTPQQDSTSK